MLPLPPEILLLTGIVFKICVPTKLDVDQLSSLVADLEIEEEKVGDVDTGDLLICRAHDIET